MEFQLYPIQEVWCPMWYVNTDLWLVYVMCWIIWRVTQFIDKRQGCSSSFLGNVGKMAWPRNCISKRVCLIIKHKGLFKKKHFLGNILGKSESNNLNLSWETSNSKNKVCVTNCRNVVWKTKSFTWQGWFNKWHVALWDNFGSSPIQGTESQDMQSPKCME